MKKAWWLLVAAMFLVGCETPEEAKSDSPLSSYEKMKVEEVTTDMLLGLMSAASSEFVWIAKKNLPRDIRDEISAYCTVATDNDTTTVSGRLCPITAKWTLKRRLDQQIMVNFSMTVVSESFIRRVPLNYVTFQGYRIFDQQGGKKIMTSRLEGALERGNGEKVGFKTLLVAEENAKDYHYEFRMSFSNREVWGHRQVGRNPIVNNETLGYAEFESLIPVLY